MITPTTGTSPLYALNRADLLAALRRPVYGTARIDADGTVTAGTYVDGHPAWWRLGTARQARHTALIGSTGSGKTMLVRSLLDAAATAGIPAQVIDLAHGQLDRLPYPVASTVEDARTVLAELHQTATSHRDHGGRDARLRLLVIDGLVTLTRDPAGARLLHALAQVAGPAGIAIVSTAQNAGTAEFGAAVLGGDPARGLRLRLSEELVLLRTDHRPHTELVGTATNLPLITDRFDDGATTAGFGYLPRRSATRSGPGSPELSAPLITKAR